VALTGQSLSADAVTKAARKPPPISAKGEDRRVFASAKCPAPWRRVGAGSRPADRAVIPSSIDELQSRPRTGSSPTGLATALFVALKLQRPLLVEGEAGVGKTAVAHALALALGTDLIRLQCYEGLDVSHAVYEWNYARQLLEIRLWEASGASGTVDRAQMGRDLFSDAFLIKRPLLQAISATGRAPVLLIDELDRADEEFEGFLLELLAEYQITIPELGTIRATVPPIVVITSNRTRELHDALKRRCLYHWIEYPGFDKELAIVTTRLPDAPARLAAQVTAFVQELRTAELYKVAGVSEHALDWVAALVALNRTELDAAAVEHTLGVLLKNQEDLQALRGQADQDLLNRSVLLRNLLRFGELLHAAGLDVPAGALIDAARALEHRRRPAHRFLLHAPLAARARPTGLRGVRRGLQGVHWRPPWGVVVTRPARDGRTTPVPVPPGRDSSSTVRRRLGRRVEDARRARGTRRGDELQRSRVSRSKDFADFTDADIADAKAALARLSWDTGFRRTRRWTRVAARSTFAAWCATVRGWAASFSRSPLESAP
jgi:MoxR-like ATPase